MCIGLLVNFGTNETWNFRDRFAETYSSIKFHKKSVHSEPDFPRRTDMMKLVVALRNFANAPKERPRSIIWDFLCRQWYGTSTKVQEELVCYVDMFLSSMGWLRSIGTSQYRNEETVIGNRDFVCVCMCLKLYLVTMHYSVQQIAQSVINNNSRMWQIIIDYAVCWIKYRNGSR